ncbi:MAG: hypothetical protein PHF52_08650 [Sulfurospirillaceae bacterium]|nr:hypothetical protein [Sulfurospirillaceae bacterium]
MTVPQELRNIKEKLILADMEANAITDLLKDPTPENIKKARMKMEELKEELEGCL